MSEPDLIQQQRQLLQRFRVANQERIQVEVKAQLSFKTESMAANASLQQAQQASDTRLGQMTTSAEERRDTEHKAAATTLSKVQVAISAHMTTIRKAQERARTGLARVNLQHLLEQTLPETSSTEPNTDPSQDLIHRAEMAAKVAHQLTLFTIAIHLQRTAAKAQHRQQSIIIAIVAIVLLIAAFVVYQAW